MFTATSKPNPTNQAGHDTVAAGAQPWGLAWVLDFQMRKEADHERSI